MCRLLVMSSKFGVGRGPFITSLNVVLIETVGFLKRYDALEAYKAAAQDATLEIVKTGKTVKLSNLEQKKNEMNEMVDAKVRYLRSALSS